VVTAHDFLSVCPSFVLLNAEGRYCGIPEPAECNRCMQRHESSFVALSPRTQIGPWRALWGDCLQTADEIRCFSESTVRLLTRAYPNLPRERVRIVPHESDYTPARLPRVERTDELVIGVIGHISFQKGATIVKELVEALEREEINARVVVIGTLDLALPSKRLRVTGQYTRDQLVDLVETHRINAFLFPSIWPETFSYVVSEIMALDMPIAAFDLGAPADRLRGYAKASLCREVSAAAALESLVSLHRQLGSSTNGEPARLRAAGTHGR
jgi:glycosyltransferase involved in cell wall biosynthesis